MSLANAAENNLMLLLFNATTWNNWAQNDATAPLTDIRVSLHTGDPGEAGAQNTSETTYGGYVRVLVARTTVGYTVAANQATNAAAITFVEATTGPQTVTFWGMGEATTGAGVLIVSGSIDTPTAGLVVNIGVQPQFAATQLDINLD